MSAIDTQLNQLAFQNRQLGNLVSASDYANALAALDEITRIVTAIRNEIAQATAPELTPEEIAAQARARAIKNAREEGRAAGLKDAELWGEKDVLTFNPYMDVQLHEAWREGYAEGLEIPF